MLTIFFVSMGKPMKALTERELFEACENHDLDTVQAAIESGDFDINICDDLNRSLLLVALSVEISEHDGQENLPSYLLDQGIECDGTSNIADRLCEGSALHLSLLNNYTNVFLRLLQNSTLDKNAIAEDDTSSDGCFSVRIPVKWSGSKLQYHVRSFSQGYFLERATILHYACLLGKIELVEAILRSGAHTMPYANLVLNKNLIGETMIIQERDNLEIDLDPDGTEGYEVLGSGWAARESWPVTRTRRVTPLHLAARMGHLAVIQIFQRYGIPLEALDGERHSILDYAKFGLDEFKDNYEFHLRGEFSSEAVNENSLLAEELAQKKLNDIDRDMLSLMQHHGHPEIRLSLYQQLIQHLLGLTAIDDTDTLAAMTSRFSSMNMNQTATNPAEQELRQMLAVENRYFEASRSISAQTSQLKTAFFNNRYGVSKQTLSIKHIPARRLITADSTSVRDSIIRSGGENQLSSEQKIVNNLKWPSTINSYGRSYPWQNLSHGGVAIKYIHKPVPGHLGGFFMPIKPKENDYAAIMQIVSALTDGKPCLEHLLARSMIIFSNTGQPMPRSALRRLGLSLDDTQYELLLKICYLTSVKEITRRMYTGLRSNGTEVIKLPFAIIHARALILIREGHLSMAQVFSQDAHYGIASGDNITSSNIGRTLKKARNINQLYHNKVEKISEHTWPKQYRKVLQEVYGGEYDSDGEGYEVLKSMSI